MATCDLSGRKVLITGGARGLGLKMAETLAGQGAAVVIADIDAEAGAASVAALADQAHHVSFVHLDVADDASWEAAIPDVLSALGGLDVVVNNAGIEITELFVDLNPDHARKIFDINVVGTMLGVKHAFRTMRPEGPAGAGGAIINIASVAATIAFPGIAAYSASKSAVDRLSRVAAAESGRMGYGVRVNAICPGLVPNAMGAQLANDTAELGLFGSTEEAVGAVVSLTPSGRLATEQDIADAVAFLASEDSAFINGVALSVDGGMGM
ncbi:oxidoreductase [Aeromicrobium sp. A1-2]|uniref:SDR family NAD(P)-dependent oxidoreductase n=1 Tax=Aeromicrobium sp. A1-2 TaxID=2107713 RepID=UPI000E52B3BD|nr:SDR family oxidoreductase [Aeromicrobium sp. A1-2]AXT84385.1 oxidoreductase [Aeromicrobium sp. A1-2]